MTLYTTDVCSATTMTTEHLLVMKAVVIYNIVIGWQ